MDRRNFIKLTAVTGTAATLASCGNPEHEIIRFVPDEDIMPGLATWKPSGCPLCSAGCGTIVRVMDGDMDVVRNNQAGVVTRSLAKKIEGNPQHPISGGKTCVRGQAAIQATYHPDRIQQPLKLSGARGSGQYQPIAWDAAIAELVTRLDALGDAATQAALACWTRPGNSARRDLIDTFLDKFGAAPSASFELFGDDVLRRANLLSFGREQLPTYDLAQSRFVLSFGADFLGTWNSPVAQNAGYGRMRQGVPGEPGTRGKFVQVESRMSQTGASADEWVAIKPGTEGVLALGLAHVLIDEKLKRADAAGRAGALIDGWAGGLTEYTPEEVEKRTGVKAARVTRLAKELAEHGPATVIIGGAPLALTNGLFQALAVNALNALVGAVGQPGGISFMPEIPSTASRTRPVRSISTTVAAVLAGAQSPVQVLLLDGVNPVFASPSEMKVRDALLKVPFIVSFGHFLDETSVLSDLILPDHTFLEGWIDGRPESGASMAVATVAPAAMPPLYQTRATGDVLLDVSRKLKKPLTAITAMTYEEFLQASLATLAPNQDAADELWSKAQMDGGWWGEVKTKAQPAAAAAVKAETRKAADAQFDGDAGAYPYFFLPYPSQALLDGSLAHLPWLQELPDPITSAMWSNWVEVNPKTAATLKIADGDIVEIASQHGTVRAPAVVSPGIAPDVIAMPTGQGHDTYTRYASGVGSNPIKILAPVVEAETGALAWASTRVKVTRVGDGDGRLVLLAGALHESPNEGRR